MNKCENPDPIFHVNAPENNGLKYCQKNVIKDNSGFIYPKRTNNT